jgi:hypothetical protein
LNIAVWAAFLGGAFGWIVRSGFDIYYVARRDRIRALNLVRADMQSITETALALRQEEFLTALKNIDKVGVDFVDKLYITASVRAKDTDTRVIDRLGDALLGLEPSLQREIVSIYRNLVTIRLLMDRLFEHYDRKDHGRAADIANHVTPLTTKLKRQAKSLLTKI